MSIVAPESNAVLHPRFGRAPAFIIVDMAQGQRQILVNPAQQAQGGAGVQAAEFLVKQGVNVVISGAFGPKAFNVLKAAKIQMYQASSGSVDELISRFNNGELDIAESN